VERNLPPRPAVIADIGGGPGRYALWLASLGYQVEHRDLMPLHVAQLQVDAAAVPGIRTAIGDARALDLPDASADAVLASRADQSTAIREAARILRPGGVLFEGPAMILSDLDARMEDPADRAVILDAARALESVPDLIGFGPHLLVTAILPDASSQRPS
jgi:SAM-dependent methyltransferase